MGQFVVEGAVPPFDGDEFNLPADNGPELEQFYRSERIDTKLDYVGKKPVVTVRAQRFVRSCRPGDRVKHTIESIDRQGGHGIRGVDLVVVSRATAGVLNGPRFNRSPEPAGVEIFGDRSPHSPGAVGSAPASDRRAALSAARQQLRETLSAVQQDQLCNEALVERELIDPSLSALGWRLANGVNKQVWLPLSSGKAQFWNYPSGRMRRDYVLDRRRLGPLHIEAKHRWGRDTFDLEGFLRRASEDDWRGSQTDGVRKDLALLLWGTRSQSGTRAAIIDDSRILVFDWRNGWAIRAEKEIFIASPEVVIDTFLLLSPADD